MIVPNIAELKIGSCDIILIFFVKTSNIEQIKKRIQNMKKIQNDDAKIWVISKNHIEIPQSTYMTDKESFSEFLNDTQNFIKTKKRNKLNIFKTKV
jgi:predicted GTPase